MDYFTRGKLFNPNFKRDEELTNHEEIMERFSDLTSELSPENISCDGELSRAQVERRRKEIMKRWKTLEKQLGREVTEDEIHKRWMSRAGF